MGFGSGLGLGLGLGLVLANRGGISLRAAARGCIWAARLRRRDRIWAAPLRRDRVHLIRGRVRVRVRAKARARARARARVRVGGGVGFEEAHRDGRLHLDGRFDLAARPAGRGGGSGGGRAGWWRVIPPRAGRDQAAVCPWDWAREGLHLSGGTQLGTTWVGLG
jgi:hypothetical protein